MISVNSPRGTVPSRLHVWLTHPLTSILSLCVIPALVAVITTVGLSMYNHGRDEREKVIDAFADQANAFESVGFKFAEPVLNHYQIADPKAEQALVDNLIRQSQTLSNAANYLKTPDLALVETYQRDLIAVRISLGDVPSAGLDRFYKSSENLVRDRDRLIYKLDRSKLAIAANTPSKPATPDAPAQHP